LEVPTIRKILGDVATVPELGARDVCRVKLVAGRAHSRARAGKTASAAKVAKVAVK
jgi:hypothetical protein